jgi:hypothetical protein
MMDMNLENLMKRTSPHKFKSEGERRIAHFLDENTIKYHYEPGVLVSHPKDKPRIWYPDFYLQEFSMYIEYFGLSGRQSYDRGVNRKESTYSRMGLNVISLYPWNLTENWQSYIMDEIKKTTTQRYKKLMSKPYWLEKRSSQYHHVTKAQSTYRNPRCKRY